MVELEYVPSISHVSVREVKKNELKPWKVKGWVIPPKSNGGFVAKMERVLDVYKRPYDEENPVACMDEFPKQLISEGLLSVPIRLGQEVWVDYEVRKAWNGQYIHGERVIERQTFGRGNGAQNKKRLGEIHQKVGGRAIPGSRQNYTCDGQLQYTRSFRLL